MHASPEYTYSVAELTQLIENLRNPEAEIRLQSVQELAVIAGALGPVRTRDELLPFLLDSIDDEDEVIAVMAEELKKFVPLVGGAAFAHHLLPILEQLANNEEISIREKAVEGLILVSSNLTPVFLHTTFVPLILRLCKGQWFTGKSSACSLFASVYSQLPGSDKADLINSFVWLCQDPTPMVRRSAAQHLKNFLNVIEKEQVALRFVSVVQSLAKDQQDSVRLLVATVLPVIIKSLPQQDAVKIVLPLFTAAGKDESWRVRYMASDTICEVQEPLGVIGSTSLLPILLDLLRDHEPEVKAIIATKIYQFCKLLTPEAQRAVIVKDIIPPVEALVSDESQHVRASIAKVLMPLSAIVGKEQTITYLLPSFLKLLKDPFSEVRLNIISHLEEINRVIGIGQLSQSLLPAIQDLALDPAWRTRLQMIEYIPLVAKQLGVEFFNEQLSPLCFGWLRDRVYAVRQAAAQNLKTLVEIFGSQWTATKLLPGIVEMSRDRNHMHRMTYIFAINVLIGNLSTDLIIKDVIPVIISLSKDIVPNIRFNVALSLEKIFPYLDIRTAASLIFPVLEKLSQDNDPDVKYFSTQAFVALRGVNV